MPEASVSNLRFWPNLPCIIHLRGQCKLSLASQHTSFHWSAQDLSVASKQPLWTGFILTFLASLLSWVLLPIHTFIWFTSQLVPRGCPGSPQSDKSVNLDQICKFKATQVHQRHSNINLSSLSSPEEPHFFSVRPFFITNQERWHLP